MVLKQYFRLAVLYEVFNNIIETMDYVGLNSFRDKEAVEIIFLLNFFCVITRKRNSALITQIKLDALRNTFDV